MRLAVHIQALQRLQELSGGETCDPVAGAALLDIAGAESIVFRYGPNPDDIEDLNLDLLKGIVKSHLNVEIAPGEDNLHRVMEVAPDQVTVVPGGDAGTDAGVDVLGNSGEIEGIINSLQAGGIDVSILVAPNIEQIKEAHRIKADYVTINASSFTRAENAEDALVSLEEIETAALGAYHLGLRVLVAGGITHRTIGPLADIEMIEEAVLDYALFGRAFFVGLERAFAEVRDAVRWQGINE